MGRERERDEVVRVKDQGRREWGGKNQGREGWKGLRERKKGVGREGKDREGRRCDEEGR